MDLKDKQLVIINHYGVDKQLEILVEECAELIQVICKSKRFNKASHWDYNMIEELADVENIIDQFKAANPSLVELIDSIKDNKTNRQMTRIAKEGQYARTDEHI